VHLCTEYTYRRPNIRYMLGHGWLCNNLYIMMLSDRGKKYWWENCSISAGLWPFGIDGDDYHGAEPSVDEFRQAFAASLMMSRRYNWIYSHNSREQLLGRKLDVYTNGVDILPYLHVIASRQIVTTPKFVAAAREIRAMQLRDYSAALGLATATSLTGPDDTPNPRLFPAALRQPQDTEAAWRVALDYLHGKDVNFHDYFGTVTDWLVIGPFPSDENFAGHTRVLPPEQSLDLQAEYEGVGGKVRWREHHQPGPKASVDFTRIFQPTERVSAYALCYVTSATAQDIQIRLGTNDAGKLWLGGQLLYDYPREGTAYLDRDIIPARLPKGTTSLLVKVTNNQKNWGFVLRLTDTQGRPLKNAQCGLSPSNP